MGIIKSLHAWLNRTIVFPARHRALLYTLVSAQLKAGIPVASAFENLLKLPGVTPTFHKVTKIAAQSGHNGQSVIEDLSRTGYFPAMDIGIFRVAEAKGTLQSALDQADIRSDHSLGFFALVVRPNLYYCTLLSILVFFAVEARDFGYELIDDTELTGNSAIDLSVWLNEWGIATLVIAGLVIAIVVHGKLSWIGKARKALLFFDLEARYQIGMKFCALAEMMSLAGASQVEILTEANNVLAQSRYARHTIADALRKMSQFGVSFEDAIAGGILPTEQASVLDGLTPGGQRNLYPAAFHTVGILQKKLLETRYQVAEGLFRGVLLIAIMILLITLGTGLYGLTTNIQ